jgi:hypothetical protein
MAWMRRAVLVVGVLLFADAAYAQPQERPIDFLPNIYGESVNQLFASLPPIFVREFDVSTQDLQGFNFTGVLMSSLVVDVASFPLGSSSGGFIYTTEAGSLGLEPVRTNESFGPAFAERAQTIGKDRSSFGATYVHRRYDALEGRKLSSGVSVGTGVFFGNTEIDVARSDFLVNVDAFTTTLFGTYGVTDRMDVAIAVPFQQIDMDASVTTSLEFLDFVAPPATVSGSVHASGLGDISIRGKVKLFESTRPPGASSTPAFFGSAIAAGFDVRVPTGDESKLLGTGLTRLKVYGAGSFKLGRRVLPHVNVGYTFPAGSTDPGATGFFFGSETSFAAGAEGVLSERLTLVGDVLGRRLSGEGRMLESAATVSSSVEGVTILGFKEGAPLTLMLGTLGFKFNPRSTFVVSAHLIFSLNDQGMQSRMSAVIGADYTFGTGRMQGPRTSRR